VLHGPALAAMPGEHMTKIANLSELAETPLVFRTFVDSLLPGKIGAIMGPREFLMG
jgi:hypothetical protein